MNGQVDRCEYGIVCMSPAVIFECCCNCALCIISDKLGWLYFGSSNDQFRKCINALYPLIRSIESIFLQFHYSREEYGDVIAEFSRDMEDTMYCLTSKGLYIRLLTSCDGKTIHKAVEAPFGESSRKDFDKLVTDTMREIEEASAEGGAWGG